MLLRRMSERTRKAEPISGVRGRFPADIIFFDNDGTVFDSSTGVLTAVQEGFREFNARHGLNLPVPTVERIKELTGTPSTVFFPAVLPEEVRHLAPDLREDCLRHEVAAIRATGRLFEGAREMLTELRARGKKLVLVTHAGPEYLAATAEAFGYPELFDAMYHVGLHGLSDKAAMMAHALNALGLNGVPLVAVGDKAADIAAGKANGAACVFCAYGFGTEEDADGADAVIHAPLELLPLVE